MAIYADKNAKGELNGRFRVEVQKGAQRFRDRCDTIEKARKREQEFLDQLAGKLPIAANAPPSIDTRVKGAVRNLEGAIELAAGANGPWKGKDSETDNLTKLGCLLRVIGNMKLDDIGVAEMDLLIADLEARGRTGATVNRHLSAVSKFLQWCKKRNYRTVELFEFDWQEESEGRIRWIEPHEEARLMELLDADTAKLVRCAIQTGMRRGELLGLEVSCVEWHDKDGVGWVRLWNPKNGKPRSVPITYETYENLRYLADGRMPNPTDLNRAWNKARKTMRLSADPWFVFHCCRHTCATRLVQANVNLAVVKEFMGHKTIETTLRYAHVNATSLTEALQTLVARSGRGSRKVA